MKVLDFLNDEFNSELSLDQMNSKLYGKVEVCLQLGVYGFNIEHDENKAKLDVVAECTCWNEFSLDSEYSSCSMKRCITDFLNAEFEPFDYIEEPIPGQISLFQETEEN